MIKDEQIDEIVERLKKIILKIETEEAKELNRRSSDIVVDRIFREFQKMVEDYEN